MRSAGPWTPVCPGTQDAVPGPRCSKRACLLPFVPQVFLWDVSSGKVIRKYRGHDAAINSVGPFASYHPAGDPLARPHVVQQQRQAPAAALHACIRPHLCITSTLAPHQVVHAASDEVVVTGGYDQCVRVWDCKSRSTEPIQTMRAFKVGFAYAAGGAAVTKSARCMGSAPCRAFHRHNSACTPVAGAWVVLCTQTCHGRNHMRTLLTCASYTCLLAHRMMSRR